MRLFLKKAIICLILGAVGASCVQPKMQHIEPKSVVIIPEKQVPINPKDSVLVPVRKDTLVVKIDTVTTIPVIVKETVVVKDTIRKVVGEQIFNFYNITPPDISFSFPSHSIVMIPVTYVGIDTGEGNSFCEYWLYTKAGQLVCYCKNTVSGLHPVYANSYNANNHLPEYTKKIGYGEYRLVYKNISKAAVRQDLIFGLITNEGKDQIDTKVDSGQTKEFLITIFPSSTSSFKLNNNNKIPL